MGTKYYIDIDGNYIGGYDGSVPENATEIPTPPENAAQKWADGSFNEFVNKKYQIYAYREGYNDIPTTFPDKIDFITGLTRRIYPKNTYVFGELRQTVYYENREDDGYGGFSYLIPIVQETFSYVRNPTTEFPISRTNTIEWYFDDGTLDKKNSKILAKYYDDDPVLVMDELVTRRGNNIDCIILAIFKLAYLSDPLLDINDIIIQGRRFFNLHSTDRQLYMYDGALDLVEDVRSDNTLPWMDNDISSINSFSTIRSFIIYQLTNGAQS